MLPENLKICSPVHRPGRPSPRAWTRCGRAGAGLAAAALLGACAAPVAEREAAWGFGSAAAPGQAGSWEAVFDAPEVAQWAHDGDPRDRAEFARADPRLSASSGAAITAASDWPEPARASLEFPRTINVRDRNGRLTFFRTARDDHRRFFHPGWTPCR